MRVGLLCLVVAVALPGLGCKKKSGTFVYSVFVEEPYGIKAEGIEVDGKPLVLANQYPNGKSFTITVPATELLVEKKASVVYATTCGPTRMDGKIGVGTVRSNDRAGEERERSLLEKGKNDLTSELIIATPIRFAEVYVDVGGATDPVTVGTMTVDPRESPDTLPLGTCPTANEVKVGGVVVGQLAVTPKKDPRMDDKKHPDRPGTAFVDAKGGHCYQKKLHAYVGKDEDTTNMARGAPVRLEPQRVYSLDLDDFLKPSPDKLAGDLHPFRTEIQRCDVAATPATATPATAIPATKGPKPKPKPKK